MRIERGCQQNDCVCVLWCVAHVMCGVDISLLSLPPLCAVRCTLWCSVCIPMRASVRGLQPVASILLHPLLRPAGFPIAMERGCQQNDRTLADVSQRIFKQARQSTHTTFKDARSRSAAGGIQGSTIFPMPVALGRSRQWPHSASLLTSPLHYY